MCRVIQCYDVVCSFTHHLFTHLKFASHVDMAIQKSRSAVHGLLLTLKETWTWSNKQYMLSLFYQSTILSILSYASPAWYAFTPQYAHDKLEPMKYPYFIARASPKPLSPYNTPWNQVIHRAMPPGISPIQDYLSAKCQKYASKVEADKHNCLHHLVPPLHSTFNRHSERLRDCRVKHA